MKSFSFTCHIILLIIALQSQVVNAQDSIDRVLKRLNNESIPYLSVEQLAKNQAELIILDARELVEFNVSHIKNAIYVGYRDFDIDKLNETIPKDKKVVVYCSLGVRSEDIAEVFVNNGYKNVYNLYGGIFEWKNKGYPVVDNKENTTDNIHAFSKEWGIYLKKGTKTYE